MNDIRQTAQLVHLHLQTSGGNITQRFFPSSRSAPPLDVISEAHPHSTFGIVFDC